MAVEGDYLVLLRIDYAGHSRFFTALDAFDLLFQHAAEHDDTAIRRAQILTHAIADRALRLPNRTVLTVEIGHVEDTVGFFGVRHALDRRLARFPRLGRHQPDPEHVGMRIVDRHAPVDRFDETLG